MTKAIARISRISEELKLISLIRFKISVAVLGTLVARSIGLMWTITTSRAVAAVDQREDRRIAHVAAVPIVLAVDLDRLEQERQAGRGEHARRRVSSVVLEDLDLAGAHVGRADEELDRRSRPAARSKSIDSLEHVAQRIEVRTG